MHSWTPAIFTALVVLGTVSWWAYDEVKLLKRNEVRMLELVYCHIGLHDWITIVTKGQVVHPGRYKIEESHQECARCGRKRTPDIQEALGEVSQTGKEA